MLSRVPLFLNFATESHQSLGDPAKGTGALKSRITIPFLLTPPFIVDDSSVGLPCTRIAYPGMRGIPERAFRMSFGPE